HRLRSPRRHPILVSKDDRPHDVGVARPLDLLAHGHRFQHDVRHSAFPWVARYAAASVHLSGSTKLGLDEHALDRRRFLHERVGAYPGLEPGDFVFPRKDSRRSSVGRMDPRMGDNLATAARTLYRAGADPQPPTIMGY